MADSSDHSPKPSSSSDSKVPFPKAEEEDQSDQSFVTVKTTHPLKSIIPDLYPPSIAPTMAESLATTNSISIKLITEKLNESNFPTWRREMYTGLSVQNLDDYILDDTAEMNARPEYA